MSDIRTLLERRQTELHAPAGSFERLILRRDRKRRNQRIAAGVVGIAVFVAAVWIVTSGAWFDRTTTPADKPAEKPAGKTAEDVARDFIYETAFFETDLAVRHLVNDAAVSGLGLDGLEQFRRWLSFNEATGFQVIPTSCEKTGSSSLGTYVRCMFDFHGLRSEAIGRGPYSGSYFDVLVAHHIVEYGRVLDVSAYLEIAKFGPQMWDPFADWVSTTYPEDVAVMYTNDNLTDYRLTPESIRLWEKHTREYVDTRPTETGSTAAPASAGTPDVQRPVACSFVQPRARGHLELTYVVGQIEGQIEVRFVLRQMTLPGHRWRIVLRHANGGPPGPDDWRVFFEGTRLARGDSGDITVQRSVVNRTSVDIVEAKARDIQTGQFCRVQAGLA